MIDGLIIKKLKVNLDERGKLFEIVRIDDETIKTYLGKIKQVYCTTANPGVVKAWHLHHKQTDCMCCVKGNLKLVLHDTRKDSPTKGMTTICYIGEDNPLMVIIPPNVYHGFKGISEEPSIIINTTNQCYNPKNPDEYRKPWDFFDYEWSRGNF